MSTSINLCLTLIAQNHSVVENSTIHYKINKILNSLVYSGKDFMLRGNRFLNQDGLRGKLHISIVF